MAVPACTRDIKAGFSALSADAEAAELDFMQCSAASMTCSYTFVSPFGRLQAGLGSHAKVLLPNCNSDNLR